MISERDGIDMKQIRKKSIRGFCIYSNWEKEVDDERDWFWCDLGNTVENEPIYIGYDDCNDLDTGINWP